ncbi:hypothetical protein BOW52_10590 [Solemya elarraichensis gill symbiont]|uniref:Transferase n=1 Tax=Solemya elarraichensis gill symbiont TaxID=1918949 RepID=A0A1T2KV96_9GAMM|nr:hypothetical protein BOW52_10590 [Solemya elarraichensis gill symbiont]
MALAHVRKTVSPSGYRGLRAFDSLSLARSERDEQTHFGLPVIPFEEIEHHYPPEKYGLFIPIGYRDVNQLRRERYEMGKQKQYNFATYVSSRASTWPDLSVGENSLIYEHAVIQPFAEIDKNTIIRSGAHVSHHALVGDHCFIAAHAVIAGNAKVQDQCFLGLNSTIRDNISIAPGCIIAAGALVLNDTEENGVYVGVPAVKLKKPASELNLE